MAIFPPFCSVTSGISFAGCILRDVPRHNTASALAAASIARSSSSSAIVGDDELSKFLALGYSGTSCWFHPVGQRSGHVGAGQALRALLKTNKCIESMQCSGVLEHRA